MKKIDSKLFHKFEISKTNLNLVNGGNTIALSDLNIVGPSGTTNDCTGTGVIVGTMTLAQMLLKMPLGQAEREVETTLVIKFLIKT